MTRDISQRRRWTLRWTLFLAPLIVVAFPFVIFGEGLEKLVALVPLVLVPLGYLAFRYDDRSRSGQKP